jgi:hypothetical protein
MVMYVLQAVVKFYRHCEERSDAAIQIKVSSAADAARWIATA